MMTPVKLLIGIVSNRNPSYGFITSLDQMKGHIKQLGIGPGIDGFALTYMETKIESSSSLLSQGRQNLLTAAVTGGFTHLLMLDDDMTFPPDTASRLFAATVHKSLRVGGNNITDTYPDCERLYWSSAIGVNATRRQNPRKIEYTATDMNGATLESNGLSGIVPVTSCGLSVFLLNVAALTNFCPDAIHMPWFEVVWSQNHNKYMGEDRYFCTMLSRAGFKIMIDQDLSQEIGHIGEFVYSYENCSARAAVK